MFFFITVKRICHGIYLCSHLEVCDSVALRTFSSVQPSGLILSRTFSLPPATLSSWSPLFHCFLFFFFFYEFVCVLQNEMSQTPETTCVFGP